MIMTRGTPDRAHDAGMQNRADHEPRFMIGAESLGEGSLDAGVPARGLLC